MKQLVLITLSLVLACNFSTAQTYQRGDTTLNIFTINDSLKYFEFYTPEFLHENVEVGILVKNNATTYSLRYVDGSSFTPFELLFQGNLVSAKKLSTEGYMAYCVTEKPFPKISDSTNQIVSHFHLNYPIFYKARNKIEMKVYEYPAFEAKIQSISFKKGNKIEEKWKSGLYKKYKPIKDKTWMAAVCGSKFIGWLLLSDVDSVFEKIK
jgi:hypothetical protein